MIQNLSNRNLALIGIAAIVFLVVPMGWFALQPVTPPVHPSLMGGECNCGITEGGNTPVVALIAVLFLVVIALVVGWAFMKQRTQMLKAEAGASRAASARARQTLQTPPRILHNPPPNSNGFHR